MRLSSLKMWRDGRWLLRIWTPRVFASIFPGGVMVRLHTYIRPVYGL
jgi:hypothetical protein